MSSPDTIVLIHGLWLSPLSWEHWIARYTDRGYRVIAPAWPGMEADVETLRADTDPYARLEIAQILDHYEALIRELDTPPIIMGHSFGGAFTELLLDRGLGAAGVAIHPAAVKGVVRLPLATLRSGFPVLGNPGNYHRAVMLTPEQFHFSFTNLLDENEASAAYDQYAVPGPGHVLFEAGLANFNPHSAMRLDFRNPDRAPLLIIGGGQDHVVPASVTREVAGHYEKSPAVTEYLEYPERSHYTVSEAGWEEIADRALTWATSR
ncbi:alpha/beta hydrolase [Actinoplanes sp. CA-131856]